MEKQVGVIQEMNIIPELWSFDLLKEKIESSVSGTELTVDKVNRMVTLTVPTRWKVSITDGLLTILGLNDGLGGVWLDGGVYRGDR